MAYTVVRVQVAGWRDKFQDAEDDTDFQARDYPALDGYLCEMEERGWSVVSTCVGASTSGWPMMYITLHCPGPPAGGLATWAPAADK